MRRNWAVIIVPVIALVGCGGSGSHPDATPVSSARRPESTTTATTAPTSTTSRTPTTRTPPTRAPTTPTRTTRTPTTPTPTTRTPTTRTPTTHAATAAGGEQLIVVDAPAYGTTTATLSAYDATATGWVRRFGPWSARIGRNGFAPPGQKREGDGRVPSGTYGFSFFFGIEPDPGVAFPYRRIDSSALVWDDDPNSVHYNEWVDTRVEPAGVHPEPMYDAPFYDYGAVIAYNASRTPGLGSAIFLHVSNGDATAGCVALPVSELVQVLRWLTPARNPKIRMGFDAARPG